jgi:hypothetical protein
MEIMNWYTDSYGEAGLGVFFLVKPLSPMAEGKVR